MYEANTRIGAYKGKIGTDGDSDRTKIPIKQRFRSNEDSNIIIKYESSRTNHK